MSNDDKGAVGETRICQTFCRNLWFFLNGLGHFYFKPVDSFVVMSGVEPNRFLDRFVSQFQHFKHG